MSFLVEYLAEPALLLVALVLGTISANGLLRLTSPGGPEWLTRRRKVVIIFGVFFVGLFLFPASEVVTNTIQANGWPRLTVPVLLFVCLGGLMVDMSTVILVSMGAQIFGKRFDQLFPLFQPGLETASAQQGADLLLNWTGWSKSPRLRSWVARHVPPQQLNQRLHVGGKPKKVNLALVLLEQGTDPETVEVFMSQQGEKAWEQLNNEQLQVILAHGSPQLRQEALRRVR